MSSWHLATSLVSLLSTVGSDDFIACGGETPAKEAGKMRAEGKEYIVQEGDVLHFRFNV